MLAGGIAHDFNNLFASVFLNLDMVVVTGPLTAAQQAHLHDARRSLDVAGTLTRTLTTFAHGDVSERRVVDLRQLLPQIAEIALIGSTIRVECRLAPDLRRVEIDEAQFSQVMSGLVMNAREATRAGEDIRIEAENLPPGEPAGSAAPQVRIRVLDSGVGISADIIPKVFDPYFSTKQRGARKGMGLGLAICRSVIQKHGGSIAIESTVGRGTTVTCDLPALD